MTHTEIEATKQLLARLRAYGLTSTANHIELLTLECLRLRQGLWDVAKVCGADTDGDDTPAALASDIVSFALSAASDLRRDYNEALLEQQA